PACPAGAAGGVERPPVRVQLVGDHGVGLALVPVGDLGRGGDRVGDPALDVTGQGGRAQLWRGDVYRLVSGVVGVPGAEFGGYRGAGVVDRGVGGVGGHVLSLVRNLFPVNSLLTSTIMPTRTPDVNALLT